MAGTITVCALIILVAIVFFTKTVIGKRLALRAKGTADEMLNQDASTPEGAKAYFNAAIEKKTREYEAANQTYIKMTGKLEEFKKQLRDFQKQDMQLNIDINNAVEKNDDNRAKMYLEKQETLAENMSVLKTNIAELEKSSKLQKESVDHLFDELSDLKDEKEKTIFKMETAETTAALKKSVISGVGSDETDKMLEKVREGAKKAQEEASGAQVLYESSAVVKERRAREQDKEDRINAKLAALKGSKK